MAHESFEDPAIAALMNRNFVCIKVDREERPDLDDIYQHAVQLLGRQGGWPLTVFLTPQGVPFFGGTYFRCTPATGCPSFPKVLEGVAQAYRERRGEGGELGATASGGPAGTAHPHPRRVSHPAELRFGGRWHTSARRPRARRLRLPPQIPQHAVARAPAAGLHPRQCRRRRGRATRAHRHGRRRHPRSARRRLPPLQRGRGLEGSALREDALRQRPPGWPIPVGLPVERRAALARRGRGIFSILRTRDERPRGEPSPARSTPTTKGWKGNSISGPPRRSRPCVGEGAGRTRSAST